ncbi:dnaa protein helix-turn-helix [Caudoviricetes sp.]|nr:dnaa protein helix-turn-helix [Caudoviricetes sp.]
MSARVDQIVAEVAAETCITPDEIMGRSHLRDIVRARHEVWRRVRAELGWSYPMLGKRFGVDDSTVQAALKGRRGGSKSQTNAPAATHQGTGSPSRSACQPSEETGVSALSCTGAEGDQEQHPAGRETESESSSVSLDVGTRRAERSRDWSRPYLDRSPATGSLEARLREPVSAGGCQTNSNHVDARRMERDEWCIR